MSELVQEQDEHGNWVWVKYEPPEVKQEPYQPAMPHETIPGLY